MYDFAARCDAREPVRVSSIQPVSAEIDKSKPFAALTQVCRQIRGEYLKIQRSQSTVAVDWHEHNYYLRTFYPQHGDAKHGPRAIVVLLVLECYQNQNRLAVDLLPLITLQSRFPDTKVSFLHSGLVDGTRIRYTTVECQHLTDLVDHSNKTWLTAIRTSIFERINVLKYNGLTAIHVTYQTGQELADMQATMPKMMHSSVEEDFLRDLGFSYHTRWISDARTAMTAWGPQFRVWIGRLDKAGRFVLLSSANV